jgi:hypothetical protein
MVHDTVRARSASVRSHTTHSTSLSNALGSMRSKTWHLPWARNQSVDLSVQLKSPQRSKGPMVVPSGRTIKWHDIIPLYIGL